MDFESDAVDLESLDGSHTLGRRSFLIGALATGAAVSAPLNYAARARARAVPFAKDGTFKLGVASGFPRPRGIVLWTHLGNAKGNERLRLLVAKDRKFGNVVLEKDVIARADRGHTAKTTVRGLDPAEQYFYRFVTGNSSSPIGRFRTAPPKDSKTPIKIVFYSCQNYQNGYYNAQRAIAKESDVDVVVCLGDYIYESNQYEDRQGPRRVGRPQRRQRRAVHRRVPAEVPRLQERPRPEGDARRPPLHRDLGRPRVGEQQRRRQREPQHDARPDQQRLPPPRPLPGAARQRLQGLLQLPSAHPLQGRARPHLRGLPPRQARRPDPHRRAPVPRHPALRRRHRHPLPRGRRPPRTARRRPEGLVEAHPARLARQLEGVGQPGDADELRDHRHDRRDRRRVGRLQGRAPRS